MITIRKANINDLSEVCELNHKLFLHDHPLDPNLNIDWPLQPEGKDYFTKMINEDTGICFVAEADSSVIGYVVGHVNKEIDKRETVLRSELDNIYVDEAWRGKGVGKELTNALKTWAKTKGAKSMIVVAYSGNIDAISFYQASGFGEYATTLETELN